MPPQGKHQDFTFDSLRGHKARHHLRQTSKAIAGWVVEVYPDLNSVVRVTSTHPDPVSVEIKTIKANGPKNAPMYETFLLL